MSEHLYKEHTRRNLPHWHPPDSTLFVTFRLVDTIPLSTLRFYYAQKKWLQDETERIRKIRSTFESPEVLAHQERLRKFTRQWFVKFEDALHKAETGPTWLQDEPVAKIVSEALHHRDGDVYRLDAYCIMPNHVHAVFKPFLSARELREVLLREGLQFISENEPLNVILQSLKGWTAWECNRALTRKGPFWEAESYDHVVRDNAEFKRIVKYVLENPVKARLVKDWRDWKWNYQRPAAVAQTV